MASKEITLLTSLRGLAAWWVVCYHFRDALGLPADSPLLLFLVHGYLAVDFFFVLSGFVIFLSYHEALTRISWHAWHQFMLRRMARIYPLHLVILCAFLLNPLALHFFSRAGSDGARYDLGYFAASIFLVQNWGYFDELAWNVPAWSISTEFAAYLLFPLILLAVNRFCISRARHFLLATAIAAVIAVLFHSAGIVSLGNGINKLGLPRCILEFSMGAVAGHFYVSHRHIANTASGWFGAAALTLLVCALALRQPDYVYVPLIFFLLILFFATRPGNAFSVLSHPAIVYLGTISYSTYLAHYFIKEWVKFLSKSVDGISFAVYVVLVLFISMFLYRVIEKPGQTWGRRWLAKRSAGAAASGKQ